MTPSLKYNGGTYLYDSMLLYLHTHETDLYAGLLGLWTSVETFGDNTSHDVWTDPVREGKEREERMKTHNIKQAPKLALVVVIRIEKWTEIDQCR